MNLLSRGELRVVPLTSTPWERLVVSTAAAHHEAPELERVVSLTWTPGGILELVRARCVVVSDPPGVDVVSSPLATLARGRGDCLTLSTLVLSLLVACKHRASAAWGDKRFGAQLVWVVRPTSPEDHVVVHTLEGSVLDVTASAKPLDASAYFAGSTLLPGPW